MTSHTGYSPSYFGTLGYCLRDKLVRQEQAQHPAEGEQRQTKNRAEVLYYHHCYGNIQQLARQFKEVRKQNFNVIKPVFHLVLSPPAEEKISKSRFVDIAQDCAKALDFEQHQYVVILHKDTAHPHIHLVVNRIGADKHVMDGSQILRRVNQFCREAEQKYDLTRTQGMRRYRSPEERNEPSRHHRVVQLKEKIRQALDQAQDLASFKEQMRQRGYKVYKTERGISFKDNDRVFMTGSKADYPWKKIEAVLDENFMLAQKQALRQAPKLEQEPELVYRRGYRMKL